jgi:hypothetical protein
MNLKNLRPAALITVAALFAAVFLFAFFIDRKYSSWEFFFLAGGLVMLYFLLRGRKKTKIEKFYDAVIKNSASNEKGLLGDPVNNLRIKPLKKLSETPGENSIVYIFKMEPGMSKSKYEQHKEGLEQYLRAEVKFSFDDDLIIQVSEKSPLKYK